VVVVSQDGARPTRSEYVPKGGCKVHVLVHGLHADHGGLRVLATLLDRPLVGWPLPMRIAPNLIAAVPVRI
jgi:hypothetical protein